jgi:hypothetical protein
LTRSTDAETDSWPTTTEDTLIGGGAPPPAGYYPSPPPPAPDNRLGAGMLLGLLTALLVAAGIALAWFLTHRDNKAQVTTVLVSTPAPTAATTQSVPTTTAKAKHVVAVQKVALPRVIGMPVSDAKVILDHLKLKTSVTQVSSEKPAGTVVDQAPKPGKKLAKGSFVTLAVAKAGNPNSNTTTTQPATTTEPAATTTAPTPTPQPTTATMPDVSNQTEAAAAQAMNSAGLLPSLFFVPGTDPLGTVEQQAKPAGTKLAYHSHVQVNISRGPGDKPNVQVPNVVGKTLQDALRSQAGKVAQQSPLGGNNAPQNAQVLVFLGAYRS